MRTKQALRAVSAETINKVPDDTKHAKFRELAEKRTNKALECIRLIGNLSNRQNYVYEEVEVRKIIKALREAVSDAESRFGKLSGGGGEFRL
jgi:hypothetical protein